MTTTVPAVDATAHPLTTGGRAAAYWWSAGVLGSVLRSVLIVAVYVMLLMDEAPEWWIGLLIAAGFVVMTLLIHRLRADAAMHTPGALSDGHAAWRTTGAGAAAVLSARVVLDLLPLMMAIVLLNRASTDRILMADRFSPAEVYAVLMMSMAALMLVQGLVEKIIELRADWSQVRHSVGVLEVVVDALGPAVLLIAAGAVAPRAAWSDAVQFGVFLGLCFGLLGAVGSLKRLQDAQPRQSAARPLPRWAQRVETWMGVLGRRIEAVADRITDRFYDMPSAHERRRMHMVVCMVLALSVLASVLVLHLLF